MMDNALSGREPDVYPSMKFGIDIGYANEEMSEGPIERATRNELVVTPTSRPIEAVFSDEIVHHT